MRCPNSIDTENGGHDELSTNKRWESEFLGAL